MGTESKEALRQAFLDAAQEQASHESRTDKAIKVGERVLLGTVALSLLTNVAGHNADKLDLDMPVPGYPLSARMLERLPESAIISPEPASHKGPDHDPATDRAAPVSGYLGRYQNIEPMMMLDENDTPSADRIAPSAE